MSTLPLRVAGIFPTCSLVDFALVFAARYRHVSVVTGAWKIVVGSPTITSSTWL